VLLEHAQELDLGHGREIADLIEKDGAAVGELEASFFARDRSGKGPLFVTEEFRFDEIFRDGGAVDADEGLLAAGGIIVDGLGDQLLAGPRFAAQQHGGGGGGNLGHLFIEFTHLPAVADDVLQAVFLAELLFEDDIFGEQFLLFGLHELAEVEPLRQG